MKRRLTTILTLLTVLTVLLSCGLPAYAALAEDTLPQAEAALPDAAEPQDAPAPEGIPAPPRNPIHDLLEDKQVLGYRYSYEDDYYYTDSDAWQKNFGFSKAYDLIAPYVLLEYDYVRVFFTYQEKDWMIQLWKGQYGMVFYGTEIGVYNKPASDEADTVFTRYNAVAPEDQLMMEMTQYHLSSDGHYKPQFTRPYGSYWWCTGFKAGHLYQMEPASELRLAGRITLKDEEMTRLFVDGLKECGFRELTPGSSITRDTFIVEGNDVHLMWQNINEAENTVPIVVGGGALALITVLGLFAAMLSMGFLGLLFLFVLI